MKYQHLLSAAILGVATAVSASPLAVREDTGQCPVGYTMSTWVVAVTATPSTTSTPEATITPTSPAVIVSTTSIAETAVSTTSPVVVVHSQLPTESASSTPESDAAFSVSSTPAPTSEAPVPERTQTPAETTSSTESSAVVEIASTSSSTNQETSTSETSTSSSTSTSTSTSSSTSALAPAPTSTAQPVSTSSSISSSGTSGEATFYGGNVAGGTCSFSGYTLPSSLFGTALSVDMWDDASKCGACVAITGPSGNTIKAMIVDQCPSCATNHFDLFQDAFSELSALSTGVIDITWSYTSCNLDGPLKLKNKEGTSAYWFSMQVVNANEPVTALEVSTDGGSTWQSTARTYYNYFENDAGFGTDTVDVRVTGESGSSVVVKGVGCESGLEVTADSNL